MELKISKKFLFNSLILIVYCQNKLCAKLLQKISCWYDQSFFAIFQNDGTYPTSTCLDWYFQHFYIHQSKALKENTSTDSYMKSVTNRSRFIVCILLNWEETVSPTLTRQHLDNLWWRKIFVQQFKLCLLTDHSQIHFPESCWRFFEVHPASISSTIFLLHSIKRQKCSWLGPKEIRG